MINTEHSVQLSEVEAKTLTKVALASVIGTSIEWYDFYLYGMMAGLVFPKLFFPNSTPFIGVMASFLTFFGGFVARPLGSIIFGRLGDRAGRKVTLIATLLIMGIGSFLIGLVPTYDSIGVAAPIMLAVLRVLQGIGIGGEWGGSAVLSTEWSPKKHRGLMGSMTALGVPIGLLLSSLAVTLSINLTGSSFYTWGWRVPFLISIILVFVGLYIRLKITDSPIFLKAKQESRVVKSPILEVITKYPKEIVLIALSRLADQVPFYIATTFLLFYGWQTLGIAKQTLTEGSMAMAAVGIVTLPLFAHLSDKYGRKVIYRVGCLFAILYAFPFFALVNTTIPVVVILAIAFVHVGVSLTYGPATAFYTENFPTHLRFSGASLGYQLATIIGGGLAPLISVYLFHEFNSTTPISIYIVLAGVIPLIAITGLKDRSNKELEP